MSFNPFSFLLIFFRTSLIYWCFVVMAWKGGFGEVGGGLVMKLFSSINCANVIIIYKKDCIIIPVIILFQWHECTTPNRHHGLQVTNIIKHSYELRFKNILYRSLAILLSGLCMIMMNLSSSATAPESTRWGFKRRRSGALASSRAGHSTQKCCSSTTCPVFCTN